jgi:hypothetical protein
VHSLEHVLVDDNNRKVFVAPAVAQLPSDQEVREFVWGYPRRMIRSVTQAGTIHLVRVNSVSKGDTSVMYLVL